MSNLVNSASNKKDKYIVLLFIGLINFSIFCNVAFGEDVFNGIQSETSVEQDALVLPLALPIGQASGIAIDPITNSLAIFHRSGRVWDVNSFDSENRFNRKLGPITNATIAILNGETGEMIKEHGKKMFYMPHGISIDGNGNYWLTDVGSHQVYKLDKNFVPQMILGEKLVPGSDEAHFCKPTDVAIASNGDFFVADGYCNSRIIHFDKNGKFISKFGTPNSQNPPLEGEFLVPHSLALIEDLELLCVADRDNKRIQCFSYDIGLKQPENRRNETRFYMEADGIGRVYAIREREHYLIGVTNGDNVLEAKIFVMDLLTGNTEILAKGFDNSHAISINSEGDIFVSQLEPKRIIKLKFPKMLV